MRSPGNTTLTPRYDYNQIMYRLDLSRPELNLPVAFYSVQGSDRPFRSGKPAGESLFFALERADSDALPVIWQGGRLQAGTNGASEPPLFYAAVSQRPGTVPLREFVSDETGAVAYTLSTFAKPWRFTRTICYVWQP